jgi:monofunctional biosynthetic peptidoglycan transglycosylase
MAPGMTRILAIAAAALLALLAVVALYEAFAVAQARRQTPRLFAEFMRDRPGAAGLDPARLQLVVRIQDPGFAGHRGVDPASPLTTTTITQSLVKRVYFASFRPGFMKIEQTLIARLAVDPLVPKAAQLQAFVSTAYLGESQGGAVIGLAAGALAWFGKPLADLTPDEYLSLIAMLPAPNALKPGSPGNSARVARIRRYLAGACGRDGLRDMMLAQCA